MQSHLRQARRSQCRSYLDQLEAPPFIQNNPQDSRAEVDNHSLTEDTALPQDDGEEMEYEYDATPTFSAGSNCNASMDERPEPSLGDSNTERADAQQAAGRAAVVTERYEGAGKVYKENQSVFEAWKRNRTGENPYYPFKSC
ncbi:hypothetical protein FRC02_004476 [Tulasnella sp. 418]|nr:hypothetical protein FRC02_004476 [Tulasnella sp. 418]